MTAINTALPPYHALDKNFGPYIPDQYQYLMIFQKPITLGKI